MKSHTVTFYGLDRVTLQASENITPPGWTELTVDYSTVSPGTELFCIKTSSPVQPGYIFTGHDTGGRHYFVFPSMSESSAAHTDCKAVGPDSLLLPLPGDLPLQSAGFLRFLNIGLHPYFHTEQLPLEVAVIGLGPVGNLAAQAGRLLGCQVTGVDPSPHRRRLAQACGIAAVAPEEFAQKKQVFELVIDTVASSQTLNTAAETLRDNGLCSMIGIIKDGDLSAATLCRAIWQRNLIFRSGWEMKNPMAQTRRNLERALAWMRQGRLMTEPLLTGIIAPRPDQIMTAYRALANDPEHHFCYVIDWRNF